MPYDPSTKPEWDRLNAEQGKLYLAGQTNTPAYKALLAAMSPIWPPGYGLPPVGVDVPLKGLKGSKP